MPTANADKKLEINKRPGAQCIFRPLPGRQEWLKSIFPCDKKRRAAAGPNRSPAKAGPVWKRGAAEGARDEFCNEMKSSSQAICRLRRAGTPEGIRTSDLPLRRRSLYPAELQAHMKLWGSGRLPAGCPALRSFRRAKGGAVRNRLSCMESGASPRSGPPAGDALRSVFYPIAAPLSTLSEKSLLFLGKILENKRLKKLRFSPLYAIISGCL